MSVKIDSDIKAKKPDIIKNKKTNKECILTDMVIPSEVNTSSKATKVQGPEDEDQQNEMTQNLQQCHW